MKNQHHFLFLQGPASPFLRALATCLESQGASVHRIVICVGDFMFWRRRPAGFFRGTDAAWPGFLDAYVERHQITDIVMLGDGRPKHAAAVDLCRRRGLKAHIIEHGYLRPDWLTIEPSGMSSQSHFPARPEDIRRLASGHPPPAARPPYPASFLTYALCDLVFHVPNVLFGWALHPDYRAHGAVHPVQEYSGWILKALTLRRRRHRARRLEQAYLNPPGGGPEDYFLVPLQLPGDYQIRRHAPGGDLWRILEAVITSFAVHAPHGTRLLFKIHPIDNGLNRWEARIGAMARAAGVDDRVDVIDGGSLDRLIAACRGLITVNSTVGLTALQAGRPVIALAPAIYDVVGLTHQGSLADFWTALEPPDADLLEDLVRALSATIQVRGGFLGRMAVRDGAAAVAEKLLHGIPGLLAAPAPERRHFRYAREIGATTLPD